MEVIFGDLKTITKNPTYYTIYCIVAPSFLYIFSLKYNDIGPTFLLSYKLAYYFIIIVC